MMRCRHLLTKLLSDFLTQSWPRKPAPHKPEFMSCYMLDRSQRSRVVPHGQRTKTGVL